MNIAEEIFQRANPESVAIIDRNVSHSYGELNRLSEEVAEKLRLLPVLRRKGCIGLRCRDGMNYITLALGILRSGACFVPLAPELSQAECTTLIETLDLEGVMTGEAEKGGAASGFSFESTAKNRGNDWREEFEKLNPALIRFSSGTTGASKGIVLSHETLKQRIMVANGGLQVGPEDRILWVLSMAHHFVVSIMLYLWNGAAVVLPFSHLAEDLLSAAREHRASVFYGSPFHFVLLSAEEGFSSWPSLRLAVSTTAALQAETAMAFAVKYGLYPVQALGVMEVGLPFLNHMEPEKHPSSIGRPQKGFEVELRDSEGKRVRGGISGELFLKGPGMFDAYAVPWQTREVMTQPDGWFSTGDIAEEDDDGFITLLGRTKSVINVGGMKFFPEEVESVLCSHPGILEARVMGRAHPTFGSIPVAEVVKLPQSEVTPIELSSLCRKQLARYKVPVEIRFTESIPRTPSGKISRVSDDKA